MAECHCGKDGHPLHSINCPACSEALVERVARAINRAAFTYHGNSDAEEEHFWKETTPVRKAQARAAIAAVRGGDGQSQSEPK